MLRVAKKDLSKLLTTGTPKQRIKLLAEERARRKFELIHVDTKDRDPVLTNKEYFALIESFKTDHEIELYNSWLRYDRTVTTALSNLQSALAEVKIHYANLRGYILVWNTMENAELLANSILHEIKDIKERKRIARDSSKDVKLLFSIAVPDKEGYIEIRTQQTDSETLNHTDSHSKLKITKEPSLWKVMNNVRKDTQEAFIRFMSWRKATVDYMIENDFNVPTYRLLLDVFLAEAFTPLYGKYESHIKSFTPEAPIERLDKLKSRYNITPIIKTKLDENIDQEEYNQFKKNFLYNEEEE